MEMQWARGLFPLLTTCTWVLMTSAAVLSSDHSSTKASSILNVAGNSNVAGQNTAAVPSLSSVSMSSSKFSLSSKLAISSSSFVALSSGMAKELSTPELPLVSSKLVSSLPVVSKSGVRSSRPPRSESSPVAMSSSRALEQGTSVLPSVSSLQLSSLAISPSSLQRGYLSSVVASTTLALDKSTTETPLPSPMLLAPLTRLVCPNMATLNETSGVLTSPYYPRRYPSNEKCSWKILASKGERIVLVIEDLYIQVCGSSCTCDYLEIQNGSSSDGISGRRRCRSDKDSGIVYHSAKDVLRVTFVSGARTYNWWYRGFKATYIKVKYNATTTACTSGEYLNGFSGFFSTPNFPRNYPQYSRCTWNITVPSGYIIKLSFFYFRLEPNQYIPCYNVPEARVTVTNVASDDGYQPFMLCGQSLPHPVYSVGNSVQVIFTSLSSQYPGFNATYTAITDSSVCPKMATLNETSGILTSPYNPRPYPSNEKCGWKITARKGERIVFVIKDIDIRNCGSSCTCDYLEIQNGLSSDGISGRRRCRSDKDSGIVYHSAKDVLRVTFVSSSYTYRDYSGFKATYIKVKYNATTTVAACISGEYLNGFSGFFSTPNFPSIYPQYSRCTWNITVPSGYIIKLNFFYFRLEPHRSIPCYDAPGARVTVTNVASDDGYQPFMLCGQSLPHPVYSVGNSVQVIFTSLNSQYPGFNGTYTAISYSSVCPNMTILNESSGVITSPFYPRYYSNKQSCSWEIRARKGKRISLTIEDMDFEDMDIDSSGDWACGEGWSCSCGYLEIQGGSISGYDGPKWRLCSVPLTANATDVWFKERIKVLFVPDSTIGWGTRFKISYTQVTCRVSELPHTTTTKVPPARVMNSEFENRSIVVVDIDK